MYTSAFLLFALSNCSFTKLKLRSGLLMKSSITEIISLMLVLPVRFGFSLFPDLSNTRPINFISLSVFYFCWVYCCLYFFLSVSSYWLILLCFSMMSFQSYSTLLTHCALYSIICCLSFSSKSLSFSASLSLSRWFYSSRSLLWS